VSRHSHTAAPNTLITFNSSSAVNRNFVNVLRSRIQKMGLPSTSKTAGRVFAKCILDFDNRIKGDFRNNGQKWAVDVGIEAEFPEAGIDEGYMTFTNEDILSCFEPVISRIIELVRDQLRQVEHAGSFPKVFAHVFQLCIPLTLVQIALLCGEFGANEYVNQMLKLSLKLNVLRPMDSDAAKVKGAVTAGIRGTYAPRKIAPATQPAIAAPFNRPTGTVARRSWVLDKPQLFLPGVHPESERCWWVDGKDRCRGTTKMILPKGHDLLAGGSKVKVTMEKVLVPGDSLLLLDLVYTSSHDYFRSVPWSTDRNGYATDIGPETMSSMKGVLLSNPFFGLLSQSFLGRTALTLQ
jgi:hypothetical protein